MKNKKAYIISPLLIALILAVVVIAFFIVGGGKLFGNSNSWWNNLPWFGNNETAETISIINYNKLDRTLGFYDGISWNVITGEEFFLGRKNISAIKAKQDFAKFWFLSDREALPLSKKLVSDTNWKILENNKLVYDKSQYLIESMEESSGDTITRFYYHLINEDGTQNPFFVPGFLKITGDDKVLMRRPTGVSAKILKPKYGDNSYLNPQIDFPTVKVGIVNEITRQVPAPKITWMELDITSNPSSPPVSKETIDHMEKLEGLKINKPSPKPNCGTGYTYNGIKEDYYTLEESDYHLLLIKEDKSGNGQLWYRVYEINKPLDIYIHFQATGSSSSCVINRYIEVVAETMEDWANIDQYLDAPEIEMKSAAITWRNSVLIKPMKFTYYDKSNKIEQFFCVKDIGPSIMIDLNKPVQEKEICPTN